MRRIFLSQQIEEIANEYRDEVLKSYSPFGKLQKLLNDILNSQGLPHQKDYYDYVEVIKDSFDPGKTNVGLFLNLMPSYWPANNIQIGKISWLQEKVAIGNSQPREFYTYVVEALGYEKLREKIIRKYVGRLGIKACYYCNAQYAITVEEANSGAVYASYELDHCLPKSKYPYLSICFYNFHPSCSVCNKRKNNTYQPVSMYVEASGKSISDFEFSLTRESIVKYILSNDCESLDINFSCPGNPVLESEYDKTFHINAIYTQHKDEVEELLWKSRCYNDADIAAIFEQYRRLFPLHSKEDFKRMLYGHHLKPSDVHKRPLNKLLSDIAKQLGIL